MYGVNDKVSIGVDMLSLEDMRTALKDRRIRVVAEAIGVHHQTLYSIRDDLSYNPRADTMRKLSDYLTASLAA